MFSTVSPPRTDAIGATLNTFVPHPSIPSRSVAHFHHGVLPARSYLKTGRDIRKASAKLGTRDAAFDVDEGVVTLVGREEAKAVVFDVLEDASMRAFVEAVVGREAHARDHARHQEVAVGRGGKHAVFWYGRAVVGFGRRNGL